HTRFSRDWSSDVCSSDLRRREPERVAHGQYPFAHADEIGVAEGHNRQSITILDLQNGEIRRGVGSNHAGVEEPLIGQRDLDVFGVFDDVLIRHDVAVFADDHTTTDALTQGIVMEETTAGFTVEIMVPLPPLVASDGNLDLDIDDGSGHPIGDLPENLVYVGRA